MLETPQKQYWIPKLECQKEIVKHLWRQLSLNVETCILMNKIYSKRYARCIHIILDMVNMSRVIVAVFQIIFFWPNKYISRIPLKVQMSICRNFSYQTGGSPVLELRIIIILTNHDDEYWSFLSFLLVHYILSQFFTPNANVQSVTCSPYLEIPTTYRQAPSIFCNNVRSRNDVAEKWYKLRHLKAFGFFDIKGFPSITYHHHQLSCP